MTSSPLQKWVHSLCRKSRNWNWEVEKLKKQLENTHEGWNFCDWLGFPPTITEPSPVEMKHPSFGVAYACVLRSLHKVETGRGLCYISIPGSISMTSNIAKNVEAWHRATSFLFSHVRTLKATTTKKASKKLACTSTMPSYKKGYFDTKSVGRTSSQN